jgi:hypothetical protein
LGEVKDPLGGVDLSIKAALSLARAAGRAGEGGMGMLNGRQNWSRSAPDKTKSALLAHLAILTGYAILKEPL